jgi:capsular polysaccharide biosynthesis protein
VVLGSEHLIAANRTASLAKLRESEMNRVIRIRKDRRARTLRTIAPVDFESRATLIPASLYERERRYPRRYQVPRMSIRRYRGATVVPVQLAVQGNLVLPESFRHHLHPRLKNRRLTDLTHYFAVVDDLGPVRRLPGRYFHLDAEYRGHFGHLLSEQVSRLWAWPELKQRLPDLKAVLSLARGRSELSSYEVDIFGAAGIAEADLVPITDPVEVDELYGATPMLSMPDYVHPEIADLWQRIGDRLAGKAPERRYPERIFITRSDALRPCHNREQVEDRFRREGFEVIRPELLPMAEQVQTFRRADVVAGFGGSGLFTLMFRCKPATVIIVEPGSYTSVNEYLISSVLGNVQYQIDSEPDVAHPPGGWSWDAFRSGFTFDFDNEGRDLDRILSSLNTSERARPHP